MTQGQNGPDFWDQEAKLHPYMRPTGYLRAWVQHNFRRTQLSPSADENIKSLGTAVQHNVRRTLLVPSREKNISSLGAAVQHNFRCTLLVSSREENISSLGAAQGRRHGFWTGGAACPEKRPLAEGAFLK